MAEFRGALLDDDPSLTAGSAAPARVPFSQALPGPLEEQLAKHVGRRAQGIGRQATGSLSGATRSATHLGEPCRTLERTVPEEESQRTFRLETLRARAVEDTSGIPPAVWPPAYQVEPSSGKRFRQDRAQ